MVVSPLWHGPGNVHGSILEGKSYRQGEATAQSTNYVRRFWRFNVDLMHVQPHFYCVRQVEPYHRLGEVDRRSF